MNKKWLLRFQKGVLIYLVVVLSFNLWNEIEKRKLKKQFEKTIEQSEALNQQISDIIRDYQTRDRKGHVKESPS